MKKQLFNIICVTFLMSVTLNSSAQIKFQKTFGGPMQDVFQSAMPTFDGGYICGGFTASFSAGQYDVYLVKTDADGDTLWTKTFGGAGNDRGYCVRQTSDTGYIVSGFSGNTLLLIKTDSMGSLQWSKTYSAVGFGGSNSGYYVQELNGGGYIVCAGGVRMMKVDASGNFIWATKYDITIGYHYSYTVNQTDDMGFFIAGSVQMNSYFDVFLVKADANGNLVWSKTIGSAGGLDDMGYFGRQVSDGGFIISGATAALGGGEIFLIKTDSLGNFTWSKAYGTDYNYSSVIQTSDNGFLITGYATLLNPEGQYLIKTDSLGNWMWSKKYSGNGWMYSSVEQTSDGGYIISGDHNSSIDQAYLIKTDANGSSGCQETNFTPVVTNVSLTDSTPPVNVTFLTNIVVNNFVPAVSSGAIVTTLCTNVSVNEMHSQNLSNVYPNPFTHQIIITETTSKGVVEIIDRTGKVVLQQEATDRELKINSQHLTAGLYVVRYMEENKIFRTKVMKF